MTGKDITLGKYAIVCLGIVVIVTLGLKMRGAPFLLSLLMGLFMGIGAPHFVIGKMIKRRINKFNSNFPDAIELMVRGLRSGLPITETLGIVAGEIPGPVGIEFRMVADKMKIGRTMEAASRTPPIGSAPLSSNSSSSRWPFSARRAATSRRRCRTSRTCFASARR